MKASAALPRLQDLTCLAQGEPGRYVPMAVAEKLLVQFKSTLQVIEELANQSTDKCVCDLLRAVVGSIASDLNQTWQGQ